MLVHLLARRWRGPRRTLEPAVRRFLGPLSRGELSSLLGNRRVAMAAVTALLATGAAMAERPVELSDVADDMLGTRWVDKVPQKEQSYIRKKIANLTPESPIMTLENPVNLPGGTTVWHVWENCGVFNEDGRLIGLEARGRVVKARALS